MRIPQEPPPHSGSDSDAERTPSQSRQDSEEAPPQGRASGTYERPMDHLFQSPPEVSIERPRDDSPEQQDPATTQLTSELEHLNLTHERTRTNESRRFSPRSAETPHTAGSSVTASSLYNATPRPSLSPEPSTASDADERGTETSQTTSDSSNPTETSYLPDIGRLSLDNDEDPYDVGEEPLPDEPFFDHNFQSALKSGIGLARNVGKILGKCVLAQDETSDISRLLRTAKRHEGFDSPESRTIGIIGDSSSGKSSLINSLLHVQNLAHKGDFWKAVTSFVTEYRRRTPSHEAPFTIEVEYANEKEINKQLRELLFSYQELWLPDVESLASSQKKEENSEYEGIEIRSEAALATLQSIFPDAEDINPKYLRDRSDGAFDRILERLEALAKGLKWPDDARDGRWTATAADAEGCQEQVGIFMENGLWPLTNVVRAQVLKTGIILADLPGFQDINLARVKKTQQYLALCDEVFVVADIARATTNKSVRDTLKPLLRSNAEKHKGIAVIFTHADDIDLPAAIKRCANITNLPATKAAERACDTAYDISTAEHELATLRYNQIYISVRNQDIKDRVSSQYPQLRSTTTSNIFCVGNKCYEGFGKHSNRWKNLAIRESGIPLLRRFCHSIIAKAQFKVANHFLGIEIPSLIQSLELWLDASKQVALSIPSSDCIKKSQENFEACLKDCREISEVELERRVLQPLTGTPGHRLSNGAIKRKQYKAWARNNGDYCTWSCGEQNWNAELLSKMNEDLPHQWHELGEALEQQLSRFRKGLREEFEHLEAKMRTTNMPQALLQAVDFKRSDLDFAVNQEADSLRRKAGAVRYNSTGTHMNSFTLKVMIPIYRNISAQSGEGMMDRMHSHMKNEMQKRRLFPHIRERTKKKMIQSFKSTADVLSGHIADMCGSLEEQMETYRRAEVNGPDSNPEDLEKVRRATAEAHAALRDLERLAEGAREKARGLGYL